LKRITTIIIVFVISVAAAAGFFLFQMHDYANEPAGTGSTDTLFLIRPGQNVRTTSAALLEKGIITDPFKFKLLARIKGLDKKLKAGEYLLSDSMTPNIILGKLGDGKVLLHRLTIPEGYNLYQISALVGELKLCNEMDFLESATDPALVREMGLEAETFEGYLFPDTYYFLRGYMPKALIGTMVKRFQSVFTGEWKNRAHQTGFSVHQAVTLASIIEKETGAPFERPLISSVFHNRLKKRMRLESDPTVIYGITDFDGNITRKHLRAQTPYNTYKIRGLPPGPIANPGSDALKAALYPTDTQFLYFVSKRNTTHAFSTNIKDHNRAVRKYQILRK